MAKRKGTSHSLGITIPFTAKWRVNRTIKKLEAKASKLKDQVCDLSDDIDRAKEDAAKVLVKKDYDKRTADLDESLKDACACVEKAVEDPDAPPGVTLEKDCRKAAAKKLGWKDARGKKGTELAQWKALVKDCKDKGGPNGFK